MKQYDVVHWQNKLSIILDAVNNAEVSEELDDIIDDCHRFLKRAYAQLDSLYYELEEEA